MRITTQQIRKEKYLNNMERLRDAIRLFPNNNSIAFQNFIIYSVQIWNKKQSERAIRTTKR